MEQRDLYETPPTNWNYASFGSRFIAYIIDAIIITIILNIFSLITGILFNFEMFKVITSPGSIMALLISISYFAYFETGTYQATLGKKVMGLKVIKQDGKPLTKAESIFRFFAKMLSAFIFLIGYIMILFDDKNRSLHDRIANTYVIKTF
ncbi:MAG: RDD family protein [Chitinophagales bacterium]|nr:RDD family protein [Chitinophagales bacterium]MCZ2392358.1 RDD family protein [Chitinophagales bacterium]